MLELVMVVLAVVNGIFTVLNYLSGQYLAALFGAFAEGAVLISLLNSFLRRV